ncbi:MAG: hypothetical protein ACOY3L_18680, partial [Pseudomonadota bacterium]
RLLRATGPENNASAPGPQAQAPRLPAEPPPAHPFPYHNVKQRKKPLAANMFWHPGRVGERAYTPAAIDLSNAFVHGPRGAEIRQFFLLTPPLSRNFSCRLMPAEELRFRLRLACMVLTIMQRFQAVPVICYQHIDPLWKNASLSAVLD